jgi:hypothetical protein
MSPPAHKRDDVVDDRSIMSGRYRGGIDGVKVFSAYRHEDRNQLGKLIGQWLDENRDVRVVETIVTQSGGSGFHCLTITLLCAVDGDPAREVPLPDRGGEDRIRIRDMIVRLEGRWKDLAAVLTRVGASAAAREAIGEMNVERLQDSVTGLAALMKDLAALGDPNRA